MSSHRAAPIVELRSVSKSLGEHAVLKGVSLSVPKGSTFGIIGETGSGKSTLLELMIGFMAPDRGTVHIMRGSKRLAYDRQSDEILDMCGFSPQRPSLCDDLTVRENLAYFGRLWNIDSATLKKNITTAMDLCALAPWADVPTLALSTGVRKRADIGCALIHNPDVLLLDDPTSGMDRKETWRIFDLLSRIGKTGMTIILATSSVDDVSELCTQVALLRDKAIVGQLHVDDLRKRLDGPQEIMLQTREGDYRKLASILYASKAGVSRAGMRGPWFVAKASDTSALLHRLLHACRQGGQTITAIQMDRSNVRDTIRAFYEVKR